jgi:arylsulfatase A-like enzyme
MAPERPNILLILVDDLRFDEFGAGGHPYMKTPHIDRIAHEGALFERAFHTTPICSPNRASIVSGQYASRHGIIDNVGRDAASHQLPTYSLTLQQAGYETAHVGKWHEYYGEAAIPWLVAMSYKAVRTERYKYIDWTQHPGADELYDLAIDPYELTNLCQEPGSAALRADLRGELRRLVAESFGL